MSDCCSTHGMNKFFSRSARRYAKSFRKKGPDKPSRILLKTLCEQGIESRSVLDIGCGVGGIHLTLLQRGASTAQGVEVSSGMINQAKELAKELSVEDRVSYVKGDLLNVENELAPAGIVVLDKVLCCYPHPEELLNSAIRFTEERLVLSYPRSAWFPAFLFGSMNRLGRLFRWSFHPFYHDPAPIATFVKNAGFHETFVDETVLWELRIFSRN